MTKRKGGEANSKKGARERKKSRTKSGEDLTDVGTLDPLQSNPTTELELKLMSMSSSTSKTVSREGQSMSRSQGYIEETDVSNILEAYQHVLTKASK